MDANTQAQSSSKTALQKGCLFLIVYVTIVPVSSCRVLFEFQWA